MHPSGTLRPDAESHWSREKHVDCVYYWELLLEHNVLYVAVGLDETTIYTRTAHDREIAVFDALGGGGGVLAPSLGTHCEPDPKSGGGDDQ